MKTSFRCLLTLIALVSLAPLASAQKYCPGNPIIDPPILPGPAPSDGYFLGVTVSTVPVNYLGGGGEGGPESGPVVAVAPGYGETVYGQRINSVVPNSPAFHAGLEPGDILIDANGYPMDSLDDLQYAINTSEGIMEMKVIDSRSGELMWVVAETDPTNTSPVLAAQVNAKKASAQRKNQFSGNGSLQIRGRSGSQRSFGNPRYYSNQQQSGSQRSRTSNLRQQLQNASSSAARSLISGRRGPIRRGRR